MSLALALLHISAICLVGALLFTAVEWFEPNRRLAIVFKCAILDDHAGDRRRVRRRPTASIYARANPRRARSAALFVRQILPSLRKRANLSQRVRM